jgi:RNA polymerase sigma-70 factor (ECF subfamily)
MIFRLAMTYLKNIPDAEDVTQDVFIKLYKHKKEFSSAEYEKAWLIRVTINASKDVLKSAWLKRNVPIMEDIAFEHKEQSDLFFTVHRLDYKYRIVIHLYYYEDYSIKEIAKILKIKETTIQTRLQRARKQLEEILNREFQFNNRNESKEGLYEAGL